LKPLIEQGLIDSYEKDTEGLYGLKFTIKRSKKENPKENHLAVTGDAGSVAPVWVLSMHYKIT